jgi:hypothetical protein
MRKLTIVVGLLAVAALAIATAVAFGDHGHGRGNHGGNNFRAELNGYNEVVGGPGASSTGSISTTGHGRLKLRIFDDHLHYVLDYSDLSGGTTCCAHIHFAQQHVSGGVSAFLCGGGGKPACPADGTPVVGTIVAADVVGPANQGITAGQFAELVRALRNGNTYANVHTATFASGEIRGQIR